MFMGKMFKGLIINSTPFCYWAKSCDWKVNCYIDSNLRQCSFLTINLSIRYEGGNLYSSPYNLYIIKNFNYIILNKVVGDILAWKDWINAYLSNQKEERVAKNSLQIFSSVLARGV